MGKCGHSLQRLIHALYILHRSNWLHLSWASQDYSIQNDCACVQDYVATMSGSSFKQKQLALPVKAVCVMASWFLCHWRFCGNSRRHPNLLVSLSSGILHALGSVAMIPFGFTSAFNSVTMSKCTFPVEWRRRDSSCLRISTCCKYFSI